MSHHRSHSVPLTFPHRHLHGPVLHEPDKTLTPSKHRRVRVLSNEAGYLLFGATHLNQEARRLLLPTPLSSIHLQCRLDRGVFLSNELQWTCYRRNYLQLSCTLVIHPNQQQQQQHEHSASSYHFRLSALDHSRRRPVQLIQWTPKRDKGPHTEPAMVPVRPGETITFDRIQFRTATANNGKRHSDIQQQQQQQRQQYFVLQLDLVLKETESDKHHCVASVCSMPIVVRGRSPGHYNSQKTETDHPSHPWVSMYSLPST
ncbi:hypothetical protein BX666DRAFT_1910803 [Dichotomocladium elegans]|nr:hypothetical protein BX666DRAFT_1910803 [Dichotomocladium elegans]